MSFKEYFLKFTLLSKYDPSMVVISGDLSRYLMSVSKVIEKEWLTSMLHDDMEISRLMVYA